MLCGNRWFSCLFASLCFGLELSVSLTSPSCQCLAGAQCSEAVEQTHNRSKEKGRRVFVSSRGPLPVEDQGETAREPASQEKVRVLLVSWHGSSCWH